MKFLISVQLLRKPRRMLSFLAICGKRCIHDSLLAVPTRSVFLRQQKDISVPVVINKGHDTRKILI